MSDERLLIIVEDDEGFARTLKRKLLRPGFLAATTAVTRTPDRIARLARPVSTSGSARSRSGADDSPNSLPGGDRRDP